MERSIATDLPQPSQAAQRDDGVLTRVRDRFEHADASFIGLFFVTLALGIYTLSDPSRSGFYNHFVWQADAFLHGRFLIEFPVTEGPFQNGYFQDVMPVASEPGYGLLPFPPLPAVVLMPFVAVFGLATDSQLVGVIFGAINVGLCWRMTTRLTTSRSAGFLATLFFAFGTVHWYASMLSTTWFLAHVIAVTFVFLGITLALDAERYYRARLFQPAVEKAGGPRNALSETIEDSSMFLGWYRRLREYIDPLQFLAGFVFGIGALARLPIILGAPFFVFVGGGGSIWRRGFAAGLGAVIPIAALLLYNILATGHLFNPAYEHLYQTEYLGYLPPRPGECLFPQDFCDSLRIDRSLGIEDIGHVPLNALIMFGWLPIIRPDCGLQILNPACATIRPDQIGMSIFLTSPAYLLAIPAVIWGWRRRIVIGSVLAIVPIAFLNLMHFSQGWVQFGYRFSNDFAPFALILVTLAIAHIGARNRLGNAFVIALVVASIIINAWGVYWGVTLGW